MTLPRNDIADLAWSLGAIKNGQHVWNFFKFFESKVIDHVSDGELRIQTSDFSLRVGDQFSFDLAFFPDDDCILKLKDSERPVFTA